MTAGQVLVPRKPADGWLQPGGASQFWFIAIPPSSNAYPSRWRGKGPIRRRNRWVRGRRRGGRLGADESRLKVLVLERAESLSYQEVGTDHLRNHRLSTYGNNAPPGLDDAGYRVSVDPEGHERIVLPWAAEYGGLPHTLGGGTRLYQGMAWRLTPTDFHLASTYDVPEGSSLADWPLDYTELEPFYDRVEHEIRRVW